MITNLLLQFDTTDFWKINWYYPLALLGTIIAITIAYKNYKKKSPTPLSNPIDIDNNPNINSTNTNNIILNLNQQENGDNQISRSETDMEKLRRTISILFIDDDTKFKVVKILINEGWINTKSITDLKSYNDDAIKNADIVFVDVQGVGKLLDCKDEGLGLALNIKSRYSDKKVVIYSAIQIHNVFHESIQKVDFLLSKDAEPYEFISLIERFSKEIN
ncbi:hypothetical protein [Flavobacterium soli]|uniref:hypothetical protein n=1 Tax=Flavobacterium soli TaxID=344881 RepID=UPI00040BF569|nr:hypothetical protein [Flavobacterium soli]